MWEIKAKGVGDLKDKVVAVHKTELIRQRYNELRL
mgnify:CR=1 FL=1